MRSSRGRKNQTKNKYTLLELLTNGSQRLRLNWWAENIDQWWLSSQSSLVLRPSRAIRRQKVSNPPSVLLWFPTRIRSKQSPHKVWRDREIVGETEGEKESKEGWRSESLSHTETDRRWERERERERILRISSVRPVHSSALCVSMERAARIGGVEGLFQQGKNVSLMNKSN